MSGANKRYSMRLRTRGNADAADGSGDNDAATAAPAVTASRTALGNISNREGRGDREEEPKPKRTRTSARWGRSQSASRTKASAEDDGKAAGEVVGRRRALPRLAKSSEAKREKARKEAEAAAAVAAKKKEAASKRRAAAATKEAAKKKAGAKRSSNDGKGARCDGRASKRARRSTDSTDAGTAGATRRATRSRSAASRRGARRKPPGAAVEIVKADGDRVVPPNFGLTRDSFDGKNFTYGIAHYDASERSDPLRCRDYVTDMFQHLYQAETDVHPRPYMDRQDDINAKMRAILVDWLVEVHMKFRLVPETLYLCVQIIDRYCALADVARSRLQLVGVTALFLACKHEEIYPPEVRDCVYITDRAYDRQQVLDMEQTLLRALDWKISLPTAYPFLDRFLDLAKASEMTRHAAAYYLERTLQEHDLLEYRPSLVCASAVILALNNPDIREEEQDYQRELPGLPKILMEYTKFDKDELVDCMTTVAQKVNEPAICASRRHLTAVSKKYEHRKYLSVSTVAGLPSVQYVLENMD